MTRKPDPRQEAGRRFEKLAYFWLKQEGPEEAMFWLAHHVGKLNHEVEQLCRKVRRLERGRK